MPSIESAIKQKSPFEADDRPASDRLTDQLPVALGLFGVGVFESFVRFVRIQTGRTTPHPDVTTTWSPIAEKTLSGVPLYHASATDNKPPVFEYINLAVATTGNYLVVFLLLVGLVNGGIAYLLWRTHAERGRHTTGVVSGILFLLAVPLVSGHAINVRSFTLLGVLLALRSPWPTTSGLALAAAGLTSQYAIFALPGLVYDRLNRVPPRRWVKWLFRFALAVALGVSSVYLSVYVFWGEASFVASLRWSVGSAERYLLEWTPSLWNGTRTWARIHGRTVIRIGVLLALATIGSIVTLRRPPSDDEAWDVERRALAFVGLFTIPLLIRPFATYWLYPLPWIATLSTTGLLTVGDRLGIRKLWT